MTKESKGIIEFENRNSIEFEVRQDGTGWFEWDAPEELETQDGELWFDDNELIDYDGVFELPPHLIDYLDALGYDMSYCQ